MFSIKTEAGFTFTTITHTCRQFEATEFLAVFLVSPLICLEHVASSLLPVYFFSEISVSN